MPTRELRLAYRDLGIPARFVALAWLTIITLFQCPKLTLAQFNSLLESQHPHQFQLHCNHFD